MVPVFEGILKERENRFVLPAISLDWKVTAAWNKLPNRKAWVRIVPMWHSNLGNKSTRILFESNFEFAQISNGHQWSKMKAFPHTIQRVHSTSLEWRPFKRFDFWTVEKQKSLFCLLFFVHRSHTILIFMDICACQWCNFTPSYSCSHYEYMVSSFPVNCIS